MSALVRVHVHAGARRASLRSRRGDGSLRLEVPAPAERGLANRAVAELLAAVLGVGRNRVAVVRGRSSRAKVVAVEGLDETEIMRRVEDALARGGDDGR